MERFFSFFLLHPVFLFGILVVFGAFFFYCFFGAFAELIQVFFFKRLCAFEECISGVFRRIFDDVGKEHIENGADLGSRRDRELFHQIVSVYGEHFDGDGVFGDLLDHILEVAELVRLCLGRAGSEAIGDANIHEIAHVLEPDAFDQSADRRSRHFPYIIVKQVVVNEKRCFLDHFRGEAKAFEKFLGHASTNVVVVVEGGSVAVAAFGLRLSDIMEEGGKAHVESRRGAGGEGADIVFVDGVDMMQVLPDADASGEFGQDVLEEPGDTQQVDALGGVFGKHDFGKFIRDAFGGNHANVGRMRLNGSARFGLYGPVGMLVKAVV